MLFKTITGVSALLSVILLALGCFGIVWLVPVFAGIFLALALLALAFLCIVCAMVDLNKPQAENDDPVYRAIMYVYIEALMNLVLVRLHTRGLENTPKEGRFLLVCNHLFIADPGILLHTDRTGTAGDPSDGGGIGGRVQQPRTMQRLGKIVLMAHIFAGIGILRLHAAELPVIVAGINRRRRFFRIQTERQCGSERSQQ